MPGIIVDIGTGDGKFTYELAKEYPDRFVIGIDPYHEGMVEVSNKISKKPARGGVANACYVLAGVEALPDELAGLANQVFINFPWGSLLKGVATGDVKVWSNIRKICMQGARVDALFGYEEEGEAGKVQSAELPELNEAYLRDSLAPRLEEQGFTLVSAAPVGGDDLKEYPSSWAKRLAHGKPRTFYHLVLTAV